MPFPNMAKMANSRTEWVISSICGQSCYFRNIIINSGDIINLMPAMEEYQIQIESNLAYWKRGVKAKRC